MGQRTTNDLCTRPTLVGYVEGRGDVIAIGQGRGGGLVMNMYKQSTNTQYTLRSG